MSKALDATAASALASAAILAALVSALQRKALLTAEETRELYEHALLLIEEGQAESGAAGHVFELARAVIEEQVRGDVPEIG